MTGIWIYSWAGGVFRDVIQSQLPRCCSGMWTDSGKWIAKTTNCWQTQGWLTAPYGAISTEMDRRNWFWRANGGLSKSLRINPANSERRPVNWDSTSIQAGGME